MAKNSPGPQEWFDFGGGTDRYRRDDDLFRFLESKKTDKVDAELEKIARLETQFKKIQDEVGGFQATIKEVEGLKEKAQQAKKNIASVRNKTLEPLAVFVGLFTFISISFQTFANVKDVLLWVPLLAIIMGSIVIFAALVIHASSLAHDAKERRYYTGGVGLVGLIILLIGVFLYQNALLNRSAVYNQDCLVALKDMKGSTLEEAKKICKE